MQEQKFCAILKAKLISSEFTVAVPEPDFGEDMWIGSATDKTGTSPVRTIYRAQAKGVFSYENVAIDKSARRYDTNDYATTLDYAISQPNFVYFFGIRDERLERKTGAQFHIGCIPTQGFLNLVRSKYPGAGVNGDRFWFMFTLRDREEPLTNPQVVLNVRRAQNFDVTPYFDDFELGLRVCSGHQSAPQCLQPLPGRRSPA